MTATASVPRVAVLGCGYWGRNLVRNFAELGALAAVSDPNPEVALAQAKKFAVAARPAQAIFDDPAIAGVVIAAPAEMHAELARAALRAGKHVFVEKPLAITLADAEDVVALAGRAQRTLMVGHLLQYHPAFLALREMVRRNDLGQLRYLYSNRLNLGKVRREENILWSFAPHDISMILSLVGENPTRVGATGASYLSPQISDVTITNLSFPGGIEGHVFVSWLHPFKEQKLVVVGAEAMAVFDDGRPWAEKLQIFRHRIDWVEGRPEPAKAEAENVALNQAEPLRLECQHFLNCIQSGARPRTDGAEGVAVLRVLHAAEVAMATGQAVEMGEGIMHKASERHPGVTIHESACVDEGCEIGPGSRIWHFSHLMARARLGRNVIVGQNVMVGPEVAIGDGCKIQNNVSLYTGVTLENGVFCGPSAVFTNVNNPRAEIERKNEFLQTHVGRGATIGANATIVCGNDLGRYCFIAAGSVVTKPVAPFALMAGNPARRIGWMSRAGRRLGPDLVCPQDGSRYRETGPDRLEEILP